MPKCYRVPRLTGAVQYARQDLPAKIIVIHDSCMLALICLFGSDLPARSRELMFARQTNSYYLYIYIYKVDVWKGMHACTHGCISIYP